MLWARAMREYYIWRVAIHNVLVIWLRHVYLGEDPEPALARLLTMLRELPFLLAGTDALHGIEGRHREVSAYELGTYVGANLTLGLMPHGRRNERLVAAMRVAAHEDGSSMAEALQRRLPAFSRQAFIERCPDEPVIRGRRSLVNRASNLLEQERLHSRGDLEAQLNRMADDFTAREEAPAQLRGRLRELIAQANLTRRERAVLNLKLQDLSSEAVGAMLGISAQTVDVHWHNIVQKLLRANAAAVWS